LKSAAKLLLKLSWVFHVVSDVALVLSAFLVTLKSMFVFALLAAELAKVFFLKMLVLAKSHFPSYFFPRIHKKKYYFLRKEFKKCKK
jgi:hypothetical protein